MSIAIYVRVSTQRQAEAQTIDEQIERLREHARDRGWALPEANVFRDDGYSGATLKRPGLDRLRDAAAMAAFDAILLTDPDRLVSRVGSPFNNLLDAVEDQVGVGSPPEWLGGSVVMLQVLPDRRL